MRFKEVRQLIVDQTGFKLSSTELAKYYQDEKGEFDMVYGVKHYNAAAIERICQRLNRDGQVIHGTIELDDSEEMIAEIEARKAELLPIYRKRHEEARQRRLEATGEADYTIPEVKLLPRRKGFVASFGAS